MTMHGGLPLVTRFLKNLGFLAALLLAALQVTLSPQSASAWEPNRPIQFIVPAGTGGGADQMARVIQGIVSKHGLAKQPIVVVNKGGGAGAEGFLEIQGARANPHMIVISLSNLFTTPLATGVPFNWKNLTPVKMLALDEFVLWVHAESGINTVAEFIEKSKAGRLKMGGTGSRQEDQIVTVAIEKATGAQMTYIPFRGGGEVATQLVGRHVDATVNNPIEAVGHWRSGALKPLCVFDKERLKPVEKITATQSWADIPTCKEQGLDVEYLMLRGILMPPGVSPQQVQFYVDLLKRVAETPEWRDLVVQGAFNTTTMAGKDYADWLEREEERHRALMKDAGFLHTQ
jgi:putative tricarboxylic transport membrane protein